MKIKVLLLLVCFTLAFNTYAVTEENNITNTIKEGTTAEQIKKVEDAFSALPLKIEQIKGYEWGLNNSPEGLNKGFTHAFFLTFKSEEDRAIYLPHPDHKAFGAILTPYLDDVFVLDYWTK